jgi:hypothetical protein
LCTLSQKSAFCLTGHPGVADISCDRGALVDPQFVKKVYPTTDIKLYDDALTVKPRKISS